MKASERITNKLAAEEPIVWQDAASLIQEIHLMEHKNATLLADKARLEHLLGRAAEYGRTALTTYVWTLVPGFGWKFDRAAIDRTMEAGK